MTTRNHFCKFYSERSLRALLAERKQGLDVMRSSIDKQKRETCVFDTGLYL